MSFDFNIKGKKYGFVASMPENEGYSMLSDKPKQMLSNLRAMQAIKFRGADEKGKRWVLDAAGCLDRLDAFLLQVSRIAKHADLLTRVELSDQAENAKHMAGQREGGTFFTFSLSWKITGLFPIGWQNIKM